MPLSTEHVQRFPTPAELPDWTGEIENLEQDETDLSHDRYQLTLPISSIALRRLLDDGELCNRVELQRIGNRLDLVLHA